MSETFLLEVLRPSEKIYEGDVLSIKAAALDGELGILPHHAPLMTVLGEGEITIHPKEGSQFAIEVPSGILKVEHNLAQVFLAR